MTPQELKAILDCSEKTAYNKYYGYTEFKMQELVSIASFYGISVDKLVQLIQQGELSSLERDFKWD